MSTPNQRSSDAQPPDSNDPADAPADGAVSEPAADADRAPESADADSTRAEPSPPAAPAATSASFWQRARQFMAERYFAMDTRWLGVWRIGLGLLLCVEVLRRWYYVRPFYTNDGTLPNHFSLFAPMGRKVFSIYHAFSTLGEVNVAFFITLVIFVLFTLGYRTRLFHALAAICITSLDVRNLFLENGGVVVVNIMTVYTLFLPMGRRFSIDACLRSWRTRTDRNASDLNRPEEPSETRVYSLMVFLFLLQWAAIYFFNAVHKSGRNWHDGTAFYWFLHQDRIVTAFGVWMREHTPMFVYKVLTLGTLVLEGSLPVLILAPVFQTWTRRAATALIFTLHAGIALTSRIGPFSYVMGLFPFALLGADDWRLVQKWFGSERRRRTIVFDGASRLSFFLCRVLRRLDPFQRLEFVDGRDALAASWHVEPQRLAAPFAVLRAAESKLVYHEQAVHEALRALPFGGVCSFWLWLPGFKHALGALARRAMQRHERWADYFGLEDVASEPGVALPPAPPVLVPSARTRLLRSSAVVREGLVAVLFVAVTAQVIVQNQFIGRRASPLVRFVNRYEPEFLVELIEYPRLLQGWGMFSPEAPYEDGRIVVDGRTADGRKLDPLTGAEPDFSMHAERSWGHEQFWCDYQNKIRFSGHAGNRPHLRDYLLNAHRFSGKPEDALVAFDVWWLEDRSPPPGERLETPLPPAKILTYGNVRDSGAAPWLVVPKTRR